MYEITIYPGCRLNPIDQTCVDGWTGAAWQPFAYHRTREDAIIGMLLNKQEAATVELPESVIQETLQKLQREARHITGRITLLQQTLATLSMTAAKGA